MGRARSRLRRWRWDESRSCPSMPREWFVSARSARQSLPRRAAMDAGFHRRTGGTPSATPQSRPAPRSAQSPCCLPVGPPARRQRGQWSSTPHGHTLCSARLAGAAWRKASVTRGPAIAPRPCRFSCPASCTAHRQTDNPSLPSMP